MAPCHEDRGGDVFHQDEIAAAHVAAVGLQQEGALVARRSEARAVVEDATPAAVGRVVGHITGPLRLANLVSSHVVRLAFEM